MEYGCDNCRQFEDQEEAAEFTSPHFTGYALLVCLLARLVTASPRLVDHPISFTHSLTLTLTPPPLQDDGAGAAARLVGGQVAGL